MSAMFHAHALREGRDHAHTNVTTITRFAKNCNMAALVCYFVYFQATLSCFLDNFFLLSVWCSLEITQVEKKTLVK